MGKSPRKSTKIKQPSHPNKTNPYVGGKNYRPYNVNQKPNNNNNSQRRFSIVDSSSSDSDNHQNGPDFSHNVSNNNHHFTAVMSGSDSESSLTAVSEHDDVEASRKGSVFFANDNIEDVKYNKQRSYKNPGKSYSSRKSTIRDYHNNDDNDSSDDDDDDNSNNDESEEEQDLGLGSIYKMMNNQKRPHHSDREDDDDEDDEENDFSSSDDSDIDFVQLQAERKAKSMKAVRAMKGLKKNKKHQHQHQHQHQQQQQQHSDISSSDEDDNEDQPSDEDNSVNNDIRNHKVAAKSYKNKRSGSVSRPKYGRRKSEAALPEDINFTFDFDDFNKFGSSVIDDDEDEDGNEENNADEFESNVDDSQNQSKVSEESEEDIGEEVQFPDSTSVTNDKSKSGNNTKDINFEFNFDSPLVQVPRFKEDELNSDEDYEIDDNELLATLQADNDLEDFDGHNGDLKKNQNTTKEQGKNNESLHVRNNSMGSLNDDDENDPFLKEEEKFLVNEFENNGFDDENEDLNADVEIDYNDETGRNNLLDSFNSMNAKPDKPIVQYASDDSKFDDDEDEEEDEYVDIMDFSVPFFDKLDHGDYSNDRFKSSSNDNRSGSKRGNKSFNNGNSDEEDDSYLWNYFFSSDNNSNGEEEEQENHGYGKDDEFAFNDDFHGKNDKFDDVGFDKKQGRNSRRKSSVAQNAMESEEEYYSGDSTDVDESLPPSTQGSNFGSKMAKEVLSSKTADYRPPVLGTWMALDSRPFGIIDGLSTRTLNNISNTSNRNMEPKSKFRRSVVSSYPAATNTDDSALGLDELLNISELDNDDENDVRIWRDFNNQKKQVPLGAFRNKSILHNSMIHPDSLPIHYNQASRSNGNFEQRRSSTNGHRKGSSESRGHVNGAVKKSNSHKKPTNTYHRPTSNQKAEHDQLTARMKRRRQSIAEAVAEGYRPTKSGVFSEHALADVEEVFGDDNDLMALIKGL